MKKNIIMPIIGFLLFIIVVELGIKLYSDNKEATRQNAQMQVVQNNPKPMENTKLMQEAKPVENAKPIQLQQKVTKIIEKRPIIKKEVVYYVEKKQKKSLAHIISVTPQYSTSTNFSQLSYENCREVTRNVVVSSRRRYYDNNNGTIIGGLTGATAGAIIGNNIAQANNGSFIGGAIGAVVGSLAGSNYDNNYNYENEQIITPQTRQECQTYYNPVVRQTLIGYNVVYEYKGFQYSTLLHKKPIKTELPIDELEE